MSASQYIVEILCPMGGILRKASDCIADAITQAENFGDIYVWSPPEGTQIHIKKASDCVRQCGSNSAQKLQRASGKLEAKILDYNGALKAAKREAAESSFAVSRALKRNKCFDTHVVATKADISAAKDKLSVFTQQFEIALAELVTAKRELTSTQEELAALKKEHFAKDEQFVSTLAELAATKQTLATFRENARPKHLLTMQIDSLKKELSVKTERADSSHAELSIAHNEIATLKKEVGAAKEEAMEQQQTAMSANRAAMQAHLERAQLEAVHNESHRAVAILTEHHGRLQAEHESTQMTLERAVEDIHATKQELISAKAAAAVSSQELSMQKNSNAALASELAHARSEMANLTSELDTTKVELAAFKKPDDAATNVSTSTQGSNSPTPSTGAKLAAWANAQNIIRDDDLEARRANDAKEEAAKGRPQGTFIETFTPRGEAKRKRTKIDAIESLLGDLKSDMEAKEAEISSLKSALGDARVALTAEKEAQVSCENELAVVRSALCFTQDLVKEARSELAAAETAKTELARVGCSCSAELRVVRAVEVAAMEEIDKMHYKCIETWSVLHDVTCGLEAAARSDSYLGTTGSASQSSSDEDGSSGSEVDIAGTDVAAPPREEKEEKWSAYTPPHLRKAGFANR